MFSNHEANTYRDIRTKGTVLALLLLLIYLIYTTTFDKDAYEVEKTETVMSLVINVDSEPIDFGHPKGYMCQLKLPDDSLIELLVSASRTPNVGDKIPLKLEHYKDGKKVYTVDRMQWELH